MPSKLALGTAQFGMPYGITNGSGQVPAGEVARILDDARRYGMDTLDTAMAYGEAEQCLGEVGVSGWRVFTKLGTVAASRPAGWVQEAVESSLERLGIERLSGLLVHRSHMLAGVRGRALWYELSALRDEGLVEKIGVSIYDPGELAPLIEQHPLDVVQAPFNVLDRRLATSGWLDRLQAAGCEVHTRSAYLQGLLLLPPDALPPAFESWRHLWLRWHDWLVNSGYTPLEACLAFALAQPTDRVVIGVEDRCQLHEAVRAADMTITDLPDDLVSTDLDLISPVRWRRA